MTSMPTSSRTCCGRGRPRPVTCPTSRSRACASSRGCAPGSWFDRQDYLRQLIAPLDVVLPEHRTVLGDLLTARARGILAQFPAAPHLAHANPRAIRRAAEEAGARGFSLTDATVVRDRARRSLYSGKAAAARAHVVRTLVSQLERLTRAIDEVDCAATTLLPPSEPGTGALRRRVAANHPGHRPADGRHPARRTRRAHPLHRCAGARRVCRLLPGHPRERRPRGTSSLVARRLSYCAPFSLPRRRQCRAP